MSTRLYGCITEYGILDEVPLKLVYDHNEKVINELPEADKWPPIAKGMFAINKIEHKLYEPDYAYGGRVIHFGANFKSIEHEWPEWKVKFENLLTRLYWISADVHFKTEYTSIQTFEWHIDLNKWNIDFYHKPDDIIKPIKRDYWEFEGSPSWD